ncbi:hypothetical protein CTAYLR_000484 [Chrysophaeum taylorii]|uniref:Parkin co-regulated protein n=1 Tax=Chrysophaeum taylorii TaxID=2483200 RepID=A0AAD7XQF8_9STRA|nr:hypothetical protein CTAYLR_000484 [Chrysophaeum taylorii]
MTKEEVLLERRTLLQQQLAIVNERYNKSAVVLAKKRIMRKCESEATVEAKRREARARRQTEVEAARRAARPAPVSGAMPIPLGGEAERMRMEHVMRRAIRSLHRSSDAKAQTSSGIVQGKQRVGATLFPLRYKRGELPCVIEHRGSRNGLSWACPLSQLDYDHYLPIFFDGIRCTQEPYGFVARQGIFELVADARGHPDCILSCLHDVVKPLRLALQTKDRAVVKAALTALQHLASSNEEVGEALVPYYRQLLSVLNVFFMQRRNTGDRIHYGQRNGDDIGTTVLETLEILEKTGGKDAFAKIKYMIPAYESCP